MLIQLEIKNFAIIEHSIIDFSHGFNVLSGETGAGKSILFDAMSSILGERTSKSVVRKGEERADLKAVFLKTKELETRLKEKNIQADDDYVIVKRQINKNGRSIVKINGSIQTTQTVKEICQELVEICGQREHQELLQEDSYLPFIDNNGNKEHQENLKQYSLYYQEWKEISFKLESILSSEREKEQLLDLYRFQKEEIEAANLVIGEDEKLEEERRFLGSFEKISVSMQKSIAQLTAVDNIYDAKIELENASKYDDKIHDFMERLTKVYYELDDIREGVTSYLDGVEYDENRLNTIMYRLEDINKLKRKYADTIEGILHHHQTISEKINDFDNKEETVKKLEKEKQRIETKMQVLGNELHDARRKIAQKEEEKIVQQLKELCMPNAVLSFTIRSTDVFLSTGTSKVELLFNANKGEDMQSLSKIASGGELTRVLLAMKIANHSHEKTPTLFFDEVDEGVGGEVGRVIGHKLESLGKSVQVISISHLPQVAARADHHFLIQKTTDENRTVSKVKKLTAEERKLEIARMIYGDEKNETTLKQAEEMLKKE